MNILVDPDWEYIQERRIQAALERFQDYAEEMEIPLVEPTEFQKRFEACKLRYAEMPEFMMIPDMNIWMKLKEEILKKQALLFQDIDIEDDDTEFRYLCFKDKYC